MLRSLFAGKLCNKVFILCAILPGSELFAAEWNVVTSIEVSESYNDNVYLSAPGTEKSDFVSQINPGIFVEAEGKRSEFELDYVMQNVWYSEESEYNDTFHTFNARGNAEIYSNLFFIDATAGHTQQSISRDDTIPTDNTTISDNRSDLNMASISPYLMKQFGSDTSAAVRYRENWINYSEAGLSDISEQTLSADIHTSYAEKIDFGISYEYREIEPDDGFNSCLEAAGLDMDYSISGKLGLLAGTGYEKNEYELLSTVQVEKGKTWYAGIRWRLSRRSMIITRYGERAFGKTKSVDLMHSTRRWRWEAEYQEDYTTTASTLFTNQQRGEITDLLVQAGDSQPSSEVILSKNTTIQGTRDFGKLDINLTAFNRDRIYRVSRQAEEVYGGSLRVSWALLPRSTFILDVSKENEVLYSGTVTDKRDISSLTYVREVSRRMNLSLEYRNYELKTTSLLRNDFRQNRVLLQIRAEF